MLNSRQKEGLWLGIAIAVVMGSCPPWKELGADGNLRAYAPIFQPPPRLEGRPALTIDFPRLLLQWAMVGIVVGGLLTTRADAQTVLKETSADKNVLANAKEGEKAKSSISKDVPLQTIASTSKGSVKSEVRTIKFPDHVTLGEVLIESQDDPDYWESLAKATGTIEVPKDGHLQLEVPKSGQLNLSALNSVPEDAFYSFDFSESKVQDDDLVHLSTQKNLHELDLSHTNITDKSTEHLCRLPALRKLWLDGTKVSDSSLDQLKGMKNLVKLSLQGTEVTEFELKKLRAEFPKNCEIILANGMIV